jgi:predicted nucleic-acid-binding protein
MSKKKTNQEDAIIVLETKLKNAELTMANNRVVIESLVKTQGCLKDTLIEALCKLADIESDLF